MNKRIFLIFFVIINILVGCANTLNSKKDVKHTADVKEEGGIGPNDPLLYKWTTEFGEGVSSAAKDIAATTAKGAKRSFRFITNKSKDGWHKMNGTIKKWDEKFQEEWW